MQSKHLYSSFCACTNTDAQCPGVVNSRETGWVPRGFFTDAAEPPVDVLAVGKNPGHPLTWETLLYLDRTGEEIAEIQANIARNAFAGALDSCTNVQRSMTFHKNLLRYLSYFLDVSPNEVFENVAFTNLVKCSTPGEQDVLKRKTMNECFSRHFLREIAFFKPKVLIAFGREVEKFLLDAKSRSLHDLQVVYIKHPSYHYRRDQEAQILQDIKTEIQRHLQATDALDPAA